MINSIGSSTGGIGSVGIGAAGQGVRTDALGRPVSTATNGAAVSTTISRLAAGGAPVDGNRVEALKAAIKAGTYRIDPKAIAGAMVDSDFGADTLGTTR